MKVIVCALRRSKDADFIFRNLPQPDEFNVFFAIEEGKKARKRKFKALLTGTLLARMYTIFFTLPALLIYDKIENYLVHRDLKTKPIDENNIFSFDDINDDDYIHFVSRLAPDLILNYGTAIYKLETLKALKVPVVNFHTGILPAYRNVHTDFWAYTRRDADGLGVTAFLLNEEIDAGEVLSMQRAGIDIDNPLWMIKVDNLWNVLAQMSSAMASEVDDSFDTNLHPIISRETKSDIPGTLWKTPPAHTLFLFGLKQLLRPKLHK